VSNDNSRGPAADKLLLNRGRDAVAKHISFCLLIMPEATVVIVARVSKDDEYNPVYRVMILSLHITR